MASRSGYTSRIASHYERVWRSNGVLHRWTQGPTWELPEDFAVLEFPPSNARDMWTYATAGMSQPTDLQKVELHVFSKDRTDGLIELLTVIAHYHRTGDRLDVGHTVSFGRPWKPGSNCDHGLLSLPYLDGPALENYEIVKGESVRFLWLVPITPQERQYKQRLGLEALEEVFERSSFDYSDPYRASTV